MKLISLFPRSASRRGLLLLLTLLLCLPSHNIVHAQEYYDDYAHQQEQDDYGAPQQPADNLYHDYAARHEAGNK